MIRRIFIFLPVVAFLLTSCFKKDDPITPHPRGNAWVDTIPMTYDYRYQIYFKLGSQSQVSKNLKTDTDLGFECATGGWKVILNTSDFMKAADLGVRTFGQVQDTAHAVWKFDKSDGNPDSLAFGQWFVVNGTDTVTNQHVFAVDRGLDEAGNALGMYQVIIDSLKHGVYYFRTATLKGANLKSCTVAKDPSVNFMWFALPSGTIKAVEPPNTSYDLLFTQYTTLLYTDLGEPYPYLVTGVLSNRNGIVVAVDSTDSFESIELQTIQGKNFSAALDAIGYDWKYYSFETSSYTVREKLVFIIRDLDGIFYKLRFIGFYNKLGEKGYPVIEYQAL
jgi:hypothetical protein